MSRVPPPRLCLSPCAESKGSMSGNQSDPPIRELRNRWPFFSEGELKWLLSPKKPGSAGHPDFNEDMASHMATTIASGRQQELGSCPGPVPSESPVASSVGEKLDGKRGGGGERRSSEVGSSFTFLTDRHNDGGVGCSRDIGSLGPRSLMFQDIAVGSGADEIQECDGGNRADSVGNGGVEEARSDCAAAVYEIGQDGHPNPFHMNPFVEGLDAGVGSETHEAVPMVMQDGEIPADEGNGGEGECSSDEQNGAQYFTPLKDAGDQQEAPQNDSEAEVEVEDEDDSEEEEVMNSAVKRMSFAIEDGKQLPKFSPGEGVWNLRWREMMLSVCWDAVRTKKARRRGRDVYAMWSGYSKPLVGVALGESSDGWWA